MNLEFFQDLEPIYARVQNFCKSGTLFKERARNFSKTPSLYRRKSSEFFQVPEHIRYRPGVGIFPSLEDIFPNMTPPEVEGWDGGVLADFQQWPGIRK